MNAASMVSPPLPLSLPERRTSLRRAQRKHRSGVLNHNAVAILGFFHEVGGNDDGCANLRQGVDALPELPPAQRIGAAGRFIQEKDIGLMQQADGHREALLEPARQLAAWRIYPAAQVELLSGPSANAFAQAVAVQPIGAAEEFQVFPHRKIAVKREFLRYIAYVAPCGSTRAYVSSTPATWTKAAAGGQKPA